MKRWLAILTVLTLLCNAGALTGCGDSTMTMGTKQEREEVTEAATITEDLDQEYSELKKELVDTVYKKGIDGFNMLADDYPVYTYLAEDIITIVSTVENYASIIVDSNPDIHVFNLLDDYVNILARTGVAIGSMCTALGLPESFFKDELSSIVSEDRDYERVKTFDDVLGAAGVLEVHYNYTSMNGYQVVFIFDWTDFS